MLRFCFDMTGGRRRLQARRTWLAGLLTVIMFVAAHGTARADRTMPNGTVATAYSQTVTVYTDTQECLAEGIYFTVPGLTASATGDVYTKTCTLTLTGTPTAAGTYRGSFLFLTGSGSYPADALPGSDLILFYDITIDKASPTLSIVPSTSSLVYLNSVTLTATLSGGASPSGTVTFYDNGTSIGTASVSGSTASLTVSSLSVGSHGITATYGGDSNDNAASTTSTTTVTVTQATPSIALAASSSSASYGSSVALVATVSGAGSPTGTVTFYEGGTQLGSATISGSTAILMISSLSLGSHTISAGYNGDINNASVTSSSIGVTVGQDTPTVTLTTSSAGTGSGTSVTLVATISGGRSPTGSVTFYDGATSLGTSTVSGSAAVLTVSALASGAHSLKAVYGGDSNNASATSPAVAMAFGRSAPTITVSSSTTSPAAAQSLTLTATLSGGASPTGTVTFKDGATILGTGTISGSIAVITASSFSMGTHAIIAVYGGDSNNVGVISSAITLTVGRSDPTSDSTVRGLVASQVSSAVRFGETQIGNIFNRFEALHDEDDGTATPGSGGDPGSSQAGSGAGGRTASANGNFAGSTGAASLFNGQAGAVPALGYTNDLPIHTSLTAQSDAGRAVSQLSAALPQAVDALNKTNLLPFHVWTSGTVSFGRLRSDDSFDNRFTSSGLTLGFDRRIVEGLKMGAAVGLGFDNSEIGTDGSRVDARNFDATIYASWRFLPHLYLDVAGGYGALRFDSKRWSSDGNVMLAGVRSGRDVFGSLGVSHVSKWDGWKLSSYGRVDIVKASLDSYSETGSNIWALTYDRMNTTSVASVVGGRLAYPMLQSWGVLTPAARVEWQHAFDGGYAQSLNYVDLVGLASNYTLSGTSLARDTLSGGLGLRADVGTALSLELEYLLTTSVAGIESQRVRGAMKYGF